MVLYMSFLADNATSPLREVLLQHNRGRRYWLYYHTPLVPVCLSKINATKITATKNTPSHHEMCFYPYL